MVRSDLPLPQQIVQSAHATYEAGQAFSSTHNINSLVLCKTHSEEELIDTYNILLKKGVDVVLFREPDIGNQATALCTEPINKNKRKLFSTWKLWS